MSKRETEFGPRNLPLADTVMRLELEIEELRDLRSLTEKKAVKGDAGGCGYILLIGGALFLLFVEPISGGFALIAGLLVLAFFTGGDKAKREIEEIDHELKRRREKIVELKEKQS
jgi:hypothetical protein